MTEYRRRPIRRRMQGREPMPDVAARHPCDPPPPLEPGQCLLAVAAPVDLERAGLSCAPVPTKNLFGGRLEQGLVG